MRPKFVNVALVLLPSLLLTAAAAPVNQAKPAGSAEEKR